VDGGTISNTPIGQTKPQAGGFTALTANNAMLSNRLFAPNVKSNNFEVTPTAPITSTKPIIFQWYRSPHVGGHAEASTGIPGNTYVCGISGYTTGVADINENVAQGWEFLAVTTYINPADGLWYYRVQVHTQNDGGHEEAKWQVGVMCVHRSMAWADAASQTRR
jgi:hypothetical protein